MWRRGITAGGSVARIVSLTPAALSRDSRTLKAALAYSRFGFDSVVVEGLASDRDFADRPITVRSVTRGLPNLGRGALRKPRGRVASAAVFAAFFVYYFVAYCLRPLRVMRRGALYHLHSYEYFPLVRLWCLMFGGRYIYDAHDFYSGIQNDAEMSSVQRWIRRFQLWLETKCVAGAAAFLTVNEGTADLMAAQFGRRPAVLRNCHDRRLERRPARDIRQATGIGDQDFLVASIGQWKRGQATEAAIEALMLLPDRVHLAFVGGGYEWARPVIEARGLSGRVHLVGSVVADEVVPFIATADAALTHYSRHNRNYENALPNGFFQALAAGLPLVYADLPGIASMAKPYGAGIAAKDTTPSALADAIRRLVENENERRNQREAAVRFTASVNFEREEQILRNFVNDLLGGRAGVTPCAA
jgi:glycosyltransferase involved in cell wall biosynthesis